VSPLSSCIMKLGDVHVPQADKWHRPNTRIDHEIFPRQCPSHITPGRTNLQGCFYQTLTILTSLVEKPEFCSGSSTSTGVSTTPVHSPQPAPKLRDPIRHWFSTYTSLIGTAPYVSLAALGAPSQPRLAAACTEYDRQMHGTDPSTLHRLPLDPEVLFVSLG
jgi:hypothetical protein